MDKHEKIFKFEPFKDDIFSYNVYRRNFSGKLKLVAKVCIIPTKKVEITYIKKLKYSEQEYIASYFNDLLRLKIENQGQPFSYVVYRINYSESERVALAEVDSGFSIYAIKHLKPSECAYLVRYLKYLTNN